MRKVKLLLGNANLDNIGRRFQKSSEIEGPVNKTGCTDKEAKCTLVTRVHFAPLSVQPVDTDSFSFHFSGNL